MVVPPEEMTLRLLIAALQHDVVEAVMGDIPATVKWSYPYVEEELKKAEAHVKGKFDIACETPTLREINFLKYCDLMELALYSIEEASDGNRKMRNVANNALDAIQKRNLITMSEATDELYALARNLVTNPSGEPLHGWPRHPVQT